MNNLTSIQVNTESYCDHLRGASEQANHIVQTVCKKKAGHSLINLRVDFVDDSDFGYPFTFARVRMLFEKDPPPVTSAVYPVLEYDER